MKVLVTGATGRLGSVVCKELLQFGERTLRILSGGEPALVCTSLRFPMLAGQWFRKRAEQPLPLSGLNFCEGLAYLELADAATLIGLVLERQQPGYHQYFPAQAMALAGHTAQSTLTEFFPTTPRRRPLEQITSLVDLSALERDFGFRPGPPLTVQLDGR